MRLSRSNIYLKSLKCTDIFRLNLIDDFNIATFFIGEGNELVGEGPLFSSLKYFWFMYKNSE